mgnify:FL=1
MDERLIQRTRYILRSRFRRVQTLPDSLFFQSTRHLFEWLQNHPILSSSLTYLEKVDGKYIDDINQIYDEVVSNAQEYQPRSYEADSFEEHASACMKIVKTITKYQKSSTGRHRQLIRRLAEYINPVSRPSLNDSYDYIRDIALDGLFEYLDERLDTSNAIFGILRKYKQRSELFHQFRLRDIAKNGLEGKTGERALTVELQGYILDQGVEFFIEPTSSSGEVDLIMRDADGRYVIIDAKYIPEKYERSKIKDKLSSGFNQVARYCIDFNETEGFLVVFNQSDKKLNLGLKESDGKRYLKVGGKIAYYFPINIANLPSASQEGKATSYRFSKEDLVSEPG